MTTMTRKRLFDLIWTKPMRDAAAEIGISDVGLKKVCIRHRVPVPPQGYWNKVQAGYAPRKSVFRDVDDRYLDRVVIVGSKYNPPPEVKKALLEAKAREKEPERRIEVPSGAQPTLPATIRLMAALRKSKGDDHGLVYAADPKLFYVRVAPANIARAVSIIEALLHAAAERGFVATTGQSHLALVVEGEPTILSLKEQTKRVPHVRTEEENDRYVRRERALQANNWSLASRLYEEEPQWDYQQTGHLFIEIETNEYLRVRKRWSDTATRKLETLLNDVLAGLVVYAAAKKQDREDRARREREWQLQQQRAAEERRLAELETARLEFLEERLELFEEMERLDRYLSSLTAVSPWQEGPLQVQAFAQWAERRVETLRRACSAEALHQELSDRPLFADGAELDEGLNVRD